MPFHPENIVSLPLAHTVLDRPYLVDVHLRAVGANALARRILPAGLWIQG